ncbi:hypothetical protein C8R43DRAFT_986328 [Mycena crocata]|nr:hypothetical protein C8R43DRAFT_986328 [Mycena crocata]
MDVSTNNPDPPRLPPELERQIFEITAILQPKAVPTLIRVARRVRLWMEPSLYKVIRISAGESKRDADNAILRAVDNKPVDFFANATRRMWLSTFSLHFFGTRPRNPWSEAELTRVLHVCTGVKDIMIMGDIVKPPLLSLVAAMRPTRVSMLVNVTFADGLIDFGAPFFSRATHLHFSDLEDMMTADWPDWLTLARLPALTHLAVYCKGLDALLPRLLAALPNLAVLIAFTEDTEGTVLQHVKTPDIRLVVIEPTNGFMDEWASGGEDSWSRADDFIARKRRGEVEASCYHLAPVSVAQA